MSAAATARKRAPSRASGSPNDELMRAMGSTKGADPIPPDQYLYFLGKSEPPLQRLLALVRSKTIRYQHRSAHCVDDSGKDLRPADLERLLEMDHGNFKRTMREAVERGLIRVGGRDEGDHRAHRSRIYLCGSVVESTGYKEGEEKGGVCTDPLRYLSPGQRKIYDAWPGAQQERFYADFNPAVKYKEQLEREAIALARHIADRKLDEVFAAHALPKTRLATQPPESKLLQLNLVAGGMSQLNGSVQTQSVPTQASESVRTTKRESVPSGASLLPSEKTETCFGSVGQSAANGRAEGPTDRPSLSSIKALMLDEYGRRFPSDSPSVPLCQNVADAMGAAPLELLRERMRQRAGKATGMGFALALAKEVGTRWLEGAAERAAATQRGFASQRREAEAALALTDADTNDPELLREIQADARRVLEHIDREQSKAAGGGQ